MNARSKNLGDEYILTRSGLDEAAALIIDQVNFTTSELEKLIEFLERHHIVDITFRDCVFTGNEFIDVLSKSTTLKRVDISNNPLTFEQALGILVLGNKLTHLNLSNTADFFDRYVDHEKTYQQIAKLPAEIIELNKQEKEMRIAMEEAKNKPATSGWSFFGFAPSVRQVGFLDIMKVSTEKRDISILHCAGFWLAAGVMLKKTQTLQSLDLSNNIANINARNQLGNICMNKIAPGLEVNSTLKSLALGQNDLTHHSLTVMADALMRNENIPLDTLDLSGNDIRYDSNNPTGNLTQLLANPHCSIQTLVLSQEVPFSLLEICESIASNPQSKLTKLVAEFTMLNGPFVPLILQESDDAIAKLRAVNTAITFTTSHVVKEVARLMA